MDMPALSCKFQFNRETDPWPGRRNDAILAHHAAKASFHLAIAHWGLAIEN
jgi:hypothetical protein